MRLRGLEVDQFRRFDRPVRLRGMADGLNLVVGPNEMGKSTLLAALMAALFEKHRSSAKSVQSLQSSRHQTAPQVGLDFELGGGSYRIEKQFLKRPHAHLYLPDGTRVDGDDAEAALEDLLAFDQAGRRSAGDIWGVLWVVQGQFGLPTIGGSAEKTLRGCLEAELGQVIGDDHGPALIAAIDTALHELVDRRGKPRQRYLALEQERRELSEQIASLEQRAEDLEQDLSRLDQEQRTFEQLSSERAGVDPTTLAKARAQRDGLMTLAARQREARATVTIARQNLAQAQGRAEERAQQLAALAGAESDLKQTASAEAERSKQAKASAAALSWQQTEIGRLEAEQIQHQKPSGALESLRRAIRQADDSRAGLDARATEVTLTLEPDALGRVQIAGRAAERTKQALDTVDPLEVAIEGIGTIMIRPRVGQAERWRRDLADAKHQIAGLLEELELAQPDTPAEQGPGQLSLFAPRTSRPPDAAAIEALQAKIERQLETLATQIEAARAELDERVISHRREEVALAQAKAQLEHAQEHHEQLRSSLAGAETATSQAELDEAVTVAQKALEEAEVEVHLLAEGDPSAALAEVEAKIVALEAAIEQRRSRHAELQGSIEGLQAKIQLHAGEGFAERLEGARRRFSEVTREHAKRQREVAVLRLLLTTLRDAEREAKERYLAPVVERMRPYLQALFADAEIEINPSLQVTRIRRDPTGDEPFAQLSEGTREQIAVLVRLALAELLADQGLPAVVVLDDALVFSDDQRMARMFEILERASKRLQILVLTCRERLFEGLSGKRLHLEPAGPTETRGAA